MQNEYLTKFRRLQNLRGDGGVVRMLRARHAMCRCYSFAVPNSTAIRELVNMSPVVEMGAGSGYWAGLVRHAGGDITAFDRHPGAGNKYAFTMNHSDVAVGDEGILSNFDERHSLFLCWPNYNTDFASNCLLAFSGNTLAYAGEDRGGCTANDKFFELLDLQWKLVRTIRIPQWPGIHDSFRIYRRSAQGLRGFQGS